MTAQLSWKRALEDSSPVMVNGSSDPAAELELFHEDQPQELKEEAPAAACSQQKELSDTKEEEKEDGSPKTLEEEKQKTSALDDFYKSFVSADLYNSLSKPQESTVGVNQLH